MDEPTVVPNAPAQAPTVESSAPARKNNAAKQKRVEALQKSLSNLRKESEFCYREDMTQYTLLALVAATGQSEEKPHPEGKGHILPPISPFPGSGIVDKIGIVGVGFTGYHDRRYNRVPQIISVYAQVGLTPDGTFAVGRPEKRTLTGPPVTADGKLVGTYPGKINIYQAYPGFSVDDELDQAEMSVTYAQQLLHVLTTAAGWQTAQDNNLVGVEGLGKPIPCVTQARPDSPDAAPVSPKIVPLAEAQLEKLPGDDDIVWDVAGVSVGNNIAAPKISGRYRPIGLPWALVGSHSRCVYAQMGDVRIHWVC